MKNLALSALIPVCWTILSVKRLALEIQAVNLTVELTWRTAWTRVRAKVTVQRDVSNVSLTFVKAFNAAILKPTKTLSSVRNGFRKLLIVYLCEKNRLEHNLPRTNLSRLRLQLPAARFCLRWIVCTRLRRRHSRMPMSIGLSTWLSMWQLLHDTYDCFDNKFSCSINDDSGWLDVWTCKMSVKSFIFIY